MDHAPYRVRYAEGQRLRAADLRAEQQYLIALEKRHNLAQHAPGIVHGLDAHRDWRDRAAMRAGAAVDDDGTLIVLERAAGVADEAPQCLDAWLIRCEVPFRLRHPGRAACEFDRVRDDVRVVTIPVAAGDPPVPPVAGAVYLGRSACEDRRDRPCTAITAATVTDPAGRAVLQVGPATGRDRNGFVVSTLGRPRISLDRLGTNRFHGNVTLAGYRASATLALSQSQRLIVQARRSGARGEQIHVRMRPENADPPRLRVQFFDGLRKHERDLILPPGSEAQAVKAFQSDLVTVALQGTPNRRPFPLIPLFIGTDPTTRIRSHFVIEGEPPIEQPRAEAVDTSVDLTLRTRGGMLALEDWPRPAAQEQPARIRGCSQTGVSARQREEGRRPNGLTFFAMREAAKAPPVPGAWSVETGTPAEPRQELRLDLGPKKDGDVSVRFSLGSLGPGDEYGDWLTLNGSCLATLPHLRVEGTIEYAPIKPDHTDKNFTDLLVRAWMDGLQAAVEASTVVAVSFTGLPAVIRTGDAWNYSITVVNSSGSAITADRILETRTISGLPAPLSKVIGQQVSIQPGQQANIPVAHPAGDTPAGSMSIEIRVSGKIGNAAWWRARTTDADIPVVEGPSFDDNGIPDSVPRGLPWSYRFDVLNNADIAMTLQQVTVQEGANAPVPQLGAPVNVNAQNAHPFTPAQNAGIFSNLAIVITADFALPAGNPVSTITLNRTVRAMNDLSADIVETEQPQVNTAWTYDLDLTNVSTRGLTLKSIRQHISSVPGDFPDTAPQLVGVQPDLDIPPDTLGITINGPLVPAATTEIELRLDVEYERNDDGRRFTIREERRLTVT